MKRLSIPLRAIITNHGGPRMSSHVNLYYLHWWTLTHYIFQSEQASPSTLKLVEAGGDLKSIEQLLGPIENLQPQWHAHVREIKRRFP